MNLGALAADFQHEFGRLVVNVRSRILNPSPYRIRALMRDTDPALLHILQPQHNLIPPPQLVKADTMRNQPLLQPLEVEIPRILQQLLSMHLVAHVNGVSSEELDQIRKGVGAAVRDGGGEDGGRTDEALALEAGEEVVGAGEEGGEAEGEEVGGVAGVAEDVARDLEFAMADGDEDALLVELRNEFRYCSVFSS